jgi:hypothetical protein
MTPPPRPAACAGACGVLDWVFHGSRLTAGLIPDECRVPAAPDSLPGRAAG